jgi:hypothetical protein
MVLWQKSDTLQLGNYVQVAHINVWCSAAMPVNSSTRIFTDWIFQWRSTPSKVCIFATTHMHETRFRSDVSEVTRTPACSQHALCADAQSAAASVH